MSIERMLMRLLMIVIFTFVCTAAPLQAQDTTLLGAPLLAVNTAAQDHILLYDVTAQTSRSLSFGDGWHIVWGFAEGGCRIVYTLSDGPDFARAYSARLDGSDVRELVQYNDSPTGEWGVWEPQPSPDGSRIAFTLIERTERILPDGTRDLQHRIGWVGPEGGPPQFYSVTGDEHEAEWSPDGAWLAYISFTERVPGADIYSTAAPTPEGQAGTLIREADLWVVSADGTTKYALTNFPTGSLRGPRWSPDGLLVNFVYSPSPNNDQFWMIANQTGAIPTQLSYEWGLILDTTWFPDSTAILAAVRDFQGISENLLWRIPLVGNADTDAVRYLGADLSYADYPRFSPDGRWLALRTEYALALADPVSGSDTILTSIPLANTPPVWSPANFAGESGCL